MTASKHIGASIALAIGLASPHQHSAIAAEPDSVVILRSSRASLGPAGPAVVIADAVPKERGERAEARAARILAKNHRAFGIRTTDDAFVPAETHEVPGGSHIRFSQRYRGIEVHRGELVLSMDGRGSLTMVSDSHIPNISRVRTTPDLPASEALRRSEVALGTGSRAIGAPDRAELVISRSDDGTDRLAYRVSMTREEPPGDWEVLVDANTGDILSIEDRFVQHHGGQHVRGTGMAYDADPLSAARALYGAAGFIDGDDADTDSLLAYRVQVALDSLVIDNDMAVLRGPYCSVADIESPYDSAVYARPAPYVFDYRRSEPGFEAVMVYYHASQALRRLEALGFFLPRLRSLRLDPNGFQGKDNSHYSPSGNWIGFGTGGVDDAEDADVIWHEYGHAIHYTIVPGWGGGECAALGEGFGDYWAGSYARSLSRWRPDDAQYSWMFKWDGHNEFWPGRVLDDARRYPFDGLTPHMAGQVWASALMDVLDRVGRDVADRLVLKSLYYLTNGITARDAAYAILQADIDLYDGAHLGVLRQVLGTERGFLAPESGATILVLSDETPVAGDSSSSPPAVAGAIGLLASMQVPPGFVLQVAPWDSFDTHSLLDAAVAVVLSGRNADPLKNDTRRQRLMEFVRSGGKLLVEGSDVAARMLAGDVEPGFARDVLAIDAVTGQLGSHRLAALDDRLFKAPHILPTVLSFQSGPGAGTRHGVKPLGNSPGVEAAAQWDDAANSAGIVFRMTPGGALRTVFFSFAVATLEDSTEGAALLENAILALLKSGDATTVEDVGSLRPETARLGQNYPNPFNPSTTIRFTLSVPRHAEVRVYDLLGREVAVLLQESMSAGVHELAWDAKGMPSGVYLCQLRAGGSVQTVRMLLMK